MGTGATGLKKKVRTTVNNKLKLKAIVRKEGWDEENRSRVVEKIECALGVFRCAN